MPGKRLGVHDDIVAAGGSANPEVVARMRKAATIAAAIAAVTLLAGCGGSSEGNAARPHATASASSPGQTVPGEAVAADFALRDQRGRLVRLSDNRGGITLVTFLYTHCVDVCPLIATELNGVLRGLGARRDDARVLAVSVDPRFDTAAAVDRLVRERHLLPQFHYLRGTPAQLKPIWQAYNILVVPKNPDVMAHTASITLIDGKGRARLVYSATATTREILPDASRLLRS
jgi:protein SCO1/2